MAFNLLGSPKRRSKSGGGGGSKALDTVILIGGLGIIGIGAYFVLKSKVGVDEALDTAGRGLKNLTDAADTTFDTIAKAILGIQKGFDVGAKRRDAVGKAFDEGQKRAAARRDAVGEAIGNTGCHLQRGFSILTGGIFGKGPDCRGWSENKQVIADIETVSSLNDYY